MHHWTLAPENTLSITEHCCPRTPQVLLKTLHQNFPEYFWTLSPKNARIIYCTLLPRHMWVIIELWRPRTLEASATRLSPSKHVWLDYHVQGQFTSQWPTTTWKCYWPCHWSSMSFRAAVCLEHLERPRCACPETGLCWWCSGGLEFESLRGTCSLVTNLITHINL